MKSFSLKKRDKLLKRRQFLQLNKSGKKIQDSHFIVIYSNGSLEKNQIGITISKKIGNAVKRNKMKRLIREHFRVNRDKIGTFVDINVIAKKKAGDISTDMVFESLDGIYEKIPRRENY